MNILILSGSPRKGGNTDLLVEAFVNGASQKHNVEVVSVLKADVICWATPIYYYEMSGQMKTLIDRMNGMYEQDYQFRDVYMLSTAAEDEADTSTRAEAGLKGWVDCYPKSRMAGTLFCGGVNEAREIEGNPKLQEAFELGEKV